MTPSHCQPPSHTYTTHTPAARTARRRVQQAVTRAQESLEKLSWFEVQNVRGHIGDDGKVNEYQVVLKVAFELK